MEANKNIIDNLPDMMLAEILVKIPLKSNTIVKLVCKRWKSLVESTIFRNHFLSLHQKKSCSWSVLHKHHIRVNTTHELIGFYGCEKWGLPRSLGSYISSPFSDAGIEIVSFIIKAISNGLLLILTQDYMIYVGNPVLREWVKIRPCTLSLKSYFQTIKFGLATRVDENGVVLGYKVVLVNTRFENATNLTLQIYSSETGEWTCENVCCPCPIPWDSSPYPEPISVNGVLHWFGHGTINAGGIIAIDLYNTSPLRENHCWFIPFPNENLFVVDGKKSYKIWCRRACTTSEGFIMYINMVSESKMKVWRLNKNYYEIESREYWQLSSEIDLAHVDYGIGSIPIVMHPFDRNVVYLWSVEKSCLVSINMRDQNSMLHKESENYSDGCTISSLEKCKSYMELRMDCFYKYLLISPQFSSSVWMDSVPRPPIPLCVCCGR
ncbi:unnamed protein product [Arabidopsis lyrata]|uniref:F-box domain-containing protein n=1 Tax=Arabidopsis lyrata subsp. lyrata TaxID=81972 RepID=D7LLX9_ARALL|nr:hypothetical protein ARALYDRAFT_904940 [Arabidopsis lyrata subsp. lyrata]CAH8266904.1 unnamed protein product [Arabidopsis lyrata]